MDKDKRIKELEDAIRDIIAMILYDANRVALHRRDWDRFNEICMLVSGNEEIVSEIKEMLEKRDDEFKTEGE